MARQLDEKEHEQLEKEITEISSELSIGTYGFDIKEMSVREREAFLSSPEAKELEALSEVKWLKQNAEWRATQTPEQLRIHDMEMELLELELEKVTRAKDENTALWERNGWHIPGRDPSTCACCKNRRRG